LGLGLGCSGGRSWSSRNGVGVCKLKLLRPVLRTLQWALCELWVIRICAADIRSKLRGNCAGVAIVWIICQWNVWIPWRNEGDYIRGRLRGST
jgi:hypothetical protein